MKSMVHIIAILLLTSACQQPEDYYHIQGQAQGSTFSIKYQGEADEGYDEDIEQIFLDMDQSLSLWQENSLLSTINRSEDSLLLIPEEDLYFIPVFERALNIFKTTKQAFNPSVYPLVKAWGFGAIPPNADTIPDVESLMATHHITGFRAHLADIGPDVALSRPAGMELDFNGIAQGYTVDVIAEYLEEQGVKNYMVEVGGELKAKGLRDEHNPWTVGIDRPVDGPRELIDTLSISDAAVATSGSYRKYHERDGKRYSHCIDPRTGWPVSHTLLSVTVLAPTCMEADAYATAFMVLGVEESLELLNSELGERLEVMMIYDENGALKTIGNGRFYQAKAESN